MFNLRITLQTHILYHIRATLHTLITKPLLLKFYPTSLYHLVTTAALCTCIRVLLSSPPWKWFIWPEYLAVWLPLAWLNRLYTPPEFTLQAQTLAMVQRPQVHLLQPALSQYLVFISGYWSAHGHPLFLLISL